MEVLSMRSRFGDLDFGCDQDEIQHKAQALADRLEHTIDEFIEDVGEDIHHPSDETLTAIALAIDYINSNHWSGVTMWYGFPRKVANEVFDHLSTQVYKGSTGVLKKATSKHMRDTN